MLILYMLTAADILDRFDLRSKYPEASFQASSQSQTVGSTELGDDDKVLKMALSNDPKLAKLWKKAEQAGFSGKSPVDLLESVGLIRLL